MAIVRTINGRKVVWPIMTQQEHSNSIGQASGWGKPLRRIEVGKMPA